MEKRKKLQAHRGLMRIPEVIKKYIYHRDGGRCQICGAKGNEIHHLFGRNVEIPNYLDIPRTVKNMHPWNLILLCGECHRKIHNGTFKMTRSEKEMFIKYNKEMWNMQSGGRTKLEKKLEEMKR